MELFQVIEDGEGIEDSILRGLSAWPGRTRRMHHPALLVVSPRAAERGLPLPERCRTVLLPGELGGVPLRAASEPGATLTMRCGIPSPHLPRV